MPEFYVYLSTLLSNSSTFKWPGIYLHTFSACHYIEAFFFMPVHWAS